MDRAFTPTLYLRLRKRVSVPKGQRIVLGQIAQLLAEPDMERTLKQLPLYTPSDRDGTILLIDMMQIVREVKRLFPDMQIEHFGEPHVLVDLQPAAQRAHPLLFVLVWLLLFVGSGLAIMNFHEDVGMMEVHRKLYEMVTNRAADHPYLLQIPYSFGLGAGMVLFFNQLFKKKFSEEPSPLEVEMFMYQENVNRYVITEEYAKMHESGDSS